MGHQERFPPPGLTDRYEFREETIAGTHRNERDAPEAAIFEPQNLRQSAVAFYVGG